MPNKHVMSTEEVLTAAGVSSEEITAIKTADATTAVNTLDAIFNKLMSFVASQRVEKANLNNPLRVFEKVMRNLITENSTDFFKKYLYKQEIRDLIIFTAENQL